MDNTGSMIGELLETAQTKTTKGIASASLGIAKTVQGQMGMITDPNETSTSQKKPQSATQNSTAAEEDLARTREMVKDFYSPSDDNTQSGDQGHSDAVAQQQLAKTREELNRLHKEYFEDLQARSVPHEQSKPKVSAQEEEQEAVDAKALPPLEEPRTKAKRGTPLWVRRKMSQGERRDVNNAG